MSTSAFGLIKNAKRIHLTGYKGVAMASIAQIFVDLGKELSGSDVAEDFVTQRVLDNLSIESHVGFAAEHVPNDAQLLVFTAAHQGPNNPEVLAAKERGIPVLSQAEALGALFNDKKGIAVCGVGGKSTTSAMIAWIFSQLNYQISYSVGVGSIIGMPKTGQWDESSKYFVAEADEYVVDPNAPKEGEAITPRFTYLNPIITVCTFLAFDHPDVYRDFAHTKEVFRKFFLQIKQDGFLIINGDQDELFDLGQEVIRERPDLTLLTFGTLYRNDLKVVVNEMSDGVTKTTFIREEDRIELSLQINGKHNAMNAGAALTAAYAAGLLLKDSGPTLEQFKSTSRRFEFIGEKHGVLYYDDYAHHPREVSMMSMTIQQMYPDKQVYVVFQPHTFSRTKALFDEFVAAFQFVEHIIILPIFASAREKDDPTVSSKALADKIQFEHTPETEVQYLSSLDQLSNFCAQLEPGSVVLTLGAGDIYQVHGKIK